MGIDYHGNGTLVLAKEKDNKEFITEFQSLISMADSSDKLNMIEDERWGTVLQFAIFARRVIIDDTIELFEKYLDNIKEAQVWFDTTDEDYPTSENGRQYMVFIEIADGLMTKQYFYRRLPIEWICYCDDLFRDEKDKRIKPVVEEILNKEENFDDGLPF